MENISNSMFLLIAISTIIFVYNNLKTFLLRKIHDSATLLKQAKEDLEQVKSHNKLLLNIIYYLILSKRIAINEMVIKELDNLELIERVSSDNGDLDSKLAPYIELGILNFKNRYFRGKCLEYEETMSGYETITEVFKNEMKLNNRANTIPSSRGNKLQDTEHLNPKEYINNRELILNQIVKKIRNSLELDIIIETLVVEIYNILQLDNCVFAWYRFDASQPHWELVQEAKNHSKSFFVNNCISVGNILKLNEKVSNREIISVVETVNLSNPREREFFQALGYNSILMIPVHTKSGEIGIVNCIHDQPRLWSIQEVELLSAVIEQLTIAIDQAALYQQSCLATAKAQKKAATLEQALNKLQQEQSQIIQSEKMLSLGQLVAGVAHEINNPTNFISGNITYASEYSQHLLKLIKLYIKYYPKPVKEIQAESEKIDIDFIQEDLPKIIYSMETGAARIRKTILSLRNFSRLDEAEMKAVDLHEGIDNTLLILTHRLETKSPDRPNIQLVKDYGQLPRVQCYARSLNQVFMNIISNAIDAIEDYSKKRSSEHQSNYTGTILISTQVFHSNQIIILIGDNGSGMSPEVARRIFDPFFTTKPVGSATGLGMSITYKIIVEQHQGTVQCISAPGKGTAILIQIPI